MNLFMEIFAFVVTGDARYGREKTPVDTLSEKVEAGLNLMHALRAKDEKDNG